MDKSTDIFRLMELPDVVISNLISFLPPEACLVLRLVCKTTLNWITKHSWNSGEEFEKWKYYRLCITGKAPYTFSTAVKINLPITWFNLNNLNNPKIYESEGVSAFIELFKRRKVRLTLDVDILWMFQPIKERTFYSSFEGIKELRVHKLHTCISMPVSRNNGLTDDELFRSQFLSPPSNVVSSLRRLIIYNCEHSTMKRAGAGGNLSDELLISFITSFKNLQWLSPPPNLKKLNRGNGLVDFFMPRKQSYCPTWMSILGTAIIENDWHASGESQILEDKEQFSIDLRAFLKLRYIVRTNRNYLQNYLLLLQESHQRGILLRNVSSHVLDSMYSHLFELGWPENELRNSFKFLNSIVSLYNVNNVLRFGFCKMQRLEEVTISHNFLHHHWIYHDPPELSWDSLKSLKVSVYISEETFTSLGYNIWDLTFRRVFDNAKRRSVTTLILRENKTPDLKVESVDRSLHERTFFDASVITRNFTCLKALTIYGSSASNEYFQRLFSGLPHLTFVNVAKCSQFDGFPVQHLSAVKTLVLTIDNMPIEEAFFTTILCHMPIKQFRMITNKPSSTFTIRAILALQKGEFGKTIENFPADTWKSKYVRGKKKKILMKEFRFMKK